MSKTERDDAYLALRAQQEEAATRLRRSVLAQAEAQGVAPMPFVKAPIDQMRFQASVATLPFFLSKLSCTQSGEVTYGVQDAAADSVKAIDALLAALDEGGEK